METHMNRWEYEIARLDVCTRVARAFLSVLAAQERLRISRNLVTVAEQFEETVARRVQAGAVSPVEETRARVARAMSALERQSAERQLEIERRRLSALWGSTAPRFARVAGDLDETGVPVPLEELLPRLEQNPDIARRLAEIELRNAARALEEARARPDLSVTGGVRHLAESSDNAFVLGLGLPLPLVDRNQGSRRAAELDAHRALEEERIARVRAETSLAMIHEDWSGAHEEIITLEEEVLPQAELALDTAEDAYRRGLFRLTDVLDTQRTLFELRIRRIDTLERFHHARTDIEGLIGESVTEERR
jgi:cobalt-zinc-cadmium efflux system outer membrane protein